MKRAPALLCLAMLAACGDGGGDASGEGTESGKPQEKAETAAAAAGTDGKAASENAQAAVGAKVTPNKDRIATLGLLNKRNNLTQDLVMKTGETRRVGNVMVKLASCERTPPWEQPEEEGAFVQVFVNERPAPKKDVVWRKVFSGWLFRNAPALNVLEHPIYDVWVKKCAMNFPGEEARPATAASSRSAAKPSGSESAATSAE